MRRLILLFVFASPTIAGFTEVFTRFNCYPEPGVTEDACVKRGCLYNTTKTNPTAPDCFFSKEDLQGYKLGGVSKNEILLTRVKESTPWGTNFETLSVTQTYYGSILNVKITPRGMKRYEPQVNFPKTPSDSKHKLTLNVTSDGNLKISRDGWVSNIFDTSLGGLYFSDQFIQIATKLPAGTMYGWGENIHQSLGHNFENYTTWGMFARDEPDWSKNLVTKNLYGVHPFYVVIDLMGNAHGVLILNSNAQEVTTVPYPGYIYRTIGGNLDMYFFPGPTPEAVVQQYHRFIGTPFLPAYWALGYQLSRYGYQNLTEMQTRIAAVRDAGIPIDTAVADIDYMDRYQDFTIGAGWKGLPAYIKKLHGDGMKVILIFDPAIDATSNAFKDAINQNARFVEYYNASQVQADIQKLYPLANGTKIMLGVVWPDHHVGFPDFFDPTGNTLNWWTNQFVNFNKKAAFDGIWIDMNEPANFGTNEDDPWYFFNPDHPNITTLKCTKNNLNYPPYLTQSTWAYGKDSEIFLKTLCLDAVQSNNRNLYDQKNLYGWSETIATQVALHQSTKKRGAVISRSTFPSSGHYGGHWLGDNNAEWADLRTSIIGVQEFNLFGIPYVGADVCGFNGQSNEELCLRWQQLGAFHSFFRNHNSIGMKPQDPAVWPSVAVAARKSNIFRYTYLPYLYSLHFAASLHGGTVIRPVSFEFPNDQRQLSQGSNFMWGDTLLIAPVVTPNTTEVKVYLPQATWYGLAPFSEYGVKKVSVGAEVVAPAPKDDVLPVFIRGGKIIPRQRAGNTTTESRKNPFELLIAPDKDGNASGLLYWDDGESLDSNFYTFSSVNFDFSYNADNGQFQLMVKKTNNNGKGDKTTFNTLDQIEIFGSVEANQNSFNINGKDIGRVDTSYNSNYEILTLMKPNFIDLNSDDAITITWKSTKGAAALSLLVPLAALLISMFV